MDIHGPPAVCNGIGKILFPQAVMLCQHVITDEAAALPLSRKEANPFQFHTFRAVAAAVFYVVPHTVDSL